MDIQLKKGLLEICILAALRSEESYGYKIVADLKPIIEISESTLYPILKRLEGMGALTTRSKEHNGRLRKYYMITQLGKEKIDDFSLNIAQFNDICRFIQSSTHNEDLTYNYGGSYDKE